MDRQFAEEYGIPYYVSVDRNGRQRVIASALARYTREVVDFIIVRDNGRFGAQIYVYEDGVYYFYDERMFKSIIADIVALYDENLVRIKDINEAYQLIINERCFVSQDKLNDNEGIINFENGLLVTVNGKWYLGPHDRDVYSTIRIPANWTDEPKETPIFDEYLDTLTDGDEGLKKLILQYMGAVISNVRGYRMKKALFMIGEGDTGKSQIKSLLERILGKGNFIGIDLKEIEARFGTGAVYGTRLAGSSDMSFVSVDELKTFKKLTGGDSLFAEFKGQQGFEFTYNGFLWFCMNRLPNFGGDDGKWVYDRIMVIECKNVIAPEKQDPMLCDKMYTEREGIIHKAVTAFGEVIKNGYRFDEPECVIKARAKYMRDNNTVLSFFDECMTERLSDKISDNATTGRIYKVYKAWCAENNNGYAKSAREFRTILARYNKSDIEDMIIKTNGYEYYKSYTLSLETKKQFKSVYGYDELNSEL